MRSQLLGNFMRHVPMSAASVYVLFTQYIYTLPGQRKGAKNGLSLNLSCAVPTSVSHAYVAHRCIIPMPLQRHWNNASGRHRASVM